LLAVALAVELEVVAELVALFTAQVFRYLLEQVYLFLLERAEPVVADILLQAMMGRVLPSEH
jgi:hypothetical protein